MRRDLSGLVPLARELLLDHRHTLLRSAWAAAPASLKRGRSSSNKTPEFPTLNHHAAGQWPAHALSSLPDIAILEGNLDEALTLCDRLDSLLPDDDGEQRRGLEVTRAEVYRRRGDESQAAASLSAAAKKALRREGSYLVVPEILLVGADLVRGREPRIASPR